MQGNMTAFNLGEAQKRHIVVGCGLHRIVTPSLRQFVEPTMQKAYDALKSKNHVHTQTFQNHIKEYKGFKLNYRSINNNNSHKGKAAEKKYDYRVSNPVDFAKLFLQPFMAHMTGFDDSCDMSALLGLLCQVGDFSQDVRDAASQVRTEVRNKWAHCDFSDWTQVHFSECFQLMEELVTSLKLPSSAEQKCVQDLRDWEKRGVQLILGQPIDKDLLRMVQQDVAEMQSNLVKYKESSDSEVEKLGEQLKHMKEVLAQTEEKFGQDQATLRRDVDTIGETVTEIEGRVTTLEDGQRQLAAELSKSSATAKRPPDEAGTSCTNQDTKRSRLDKTGSDDQKEAFTSALAVKCNNTLKTLKPLPWNNRFHVDLDQIFTFLELVGHSGNGDRSRGIMFKSIDEVFDHQPVMLSGQSKRFNVLVVGDAGSGKSTLFSKTALDWSRKKGRLADMNKIVLLIRLREVEPGESIAQIVWDQCVTKSAKGISISSIETCLQDNESHVVFLLDGYDELVPDAKGPNQAVPELLAKTWYPDCMVIVSSRPFADIDDYMAVDCEVNVMGFSSDHVDKYVPLYFQCVEKPDLADPLVKALDSKANIVARGLIQTPMFLMLICVLWEENPTIVQFPVTMSGLYHELLTCVIRKHCVREGLSMSDDEIPPVVSTALHHLGKLALESLLRGESLVDLGKNTANQDTDVMVKLGIVSKEVSASRLHPRQQLNFPHKSMQEFLAGRYVADRVNTSSGDLHSLVPLDTLLQQENLVQFICGCGGKVTSELLAKLLHVRMSDLHTKVVQKRKPTFGDLLSSAEEERTSKSLKHLFVMSLYEGNDSQHFSILNTVLSSLDLTINIPSREGAALKYYLDHAQEVPEGRSLALTFAEKRDGDAVEYLSTLVGRSLPDLHIKLYLSLTQDTKSCHIGSMLDQLIPFLTNVPNMQLLNLGNTSLTPESIQALGWILPKLTMLEVLDLAHNPDIGEIDVLSKGLKSHKKLTSMNFCEIGLGDVSVKSLAAVLHHLSCLESLDLSHNNIGNDGLESFAAIQQPVASLKWLDLSCNKIGDVCLGSLVAVLHHLPCLTQLNLSQNNIGDAKLESLADNLHYTPELDEVNLNDNPVTAVGLQRFAQTIHRMPALAILSLDPQQTVHLDDTAAMSICTMVTQLPVLRLLSLKNISMQAAGFQDVATAVEEHANFPELRYNRENVPQGVNRPLDIMNI